MDEEVFFNLCEEASEMIAFGKLPDFELVEPAIREIVLEAFENGTFYSRIEGIEEDMYNTTEAKRMSRKLKTAVKKLQ